jgi:hypothetical protein
LIAALFRYEGLVYVVVNYCFFMHVVVKKQRDYDG